jgi:hypothetical protein
VPLEIQREVTKLVVACLGAGCGPTPSWLKRPGRRECGDSWSLIQRIYADLTEGGVLPETMPSRERRVVDCVLVVDGDCRILEVDEKQHFNTFRARTLAHYGDAVPVAFPVTEWIAKSDAKTRLEAGGFAKPRPPLFAGDGGRHRQRAFRDALADILPTAHGWLPTLRIADFEVKAWLFTPDAAGHMRRLLAGRLPRWESHQ